MANVSFQVARMEQELFYLNGFKAGVDGTELPPGSAEEFQRGYGDGVQAGSQKPAALPPGTFVGEINWDAPVTYTHTVGGLSVQPFTGSEIAALRKLIGGV